MGNLRDGICFRCGKNFNTALSILNRIPASFDLVESIHQEDHDREDRDTRHTDEEDERHL